MDRTPPTIWQRCLDHLQPANLWAFVIHRRTRLVAAWLVVLVTAGASLHAAWHHFDNSTRADGNDGHAAIDFGGQWLMGRLLVEGHGRQLYNRRIQREIVEANYPRADESEKQRQGEQKSDADQLMDWLMDVDNTDPDSDLIGGPLYPPINAFYFYPMGMMSPHVGYRVAQVFNLLLAFVAGWGIQRIAQGRVWWPVASFLFFIWPGFSGSINLGQNAALTVTLLVWGWVFVCERREVPAGILWGLLAFKPVWAASFFVLPVLTGRWRMALAMALTGLTLIGVTIPVVGIEAWFNWLKVGKVASAVYDYDENWVTLSRDLLSLPRRYMLNFDLPVKERTADWLPVTLLGWGLIVFVVEITVRTVVMRPGERRATEGAPAAFLLISCYMFCYHFMYYDFLLAILPVWLLFVRPAKYVQPILLLIGWPRMTAEVGRYYRPWLSEGESAVRAVFPPIPAPDEGRDPWSPPAYQNASYLMARLNSFYPMLPTDQWRVWVVNRMEPLLLLLIVYSLYFMEVVGYQDRAKTPWNQFALIAMWFWCGWSWFREFAAKRAS